MIINFFSSYEDYSRTEAVGPDGIALFKDFMIDATNYFDREPEPKVGLHVLMVLNRGFHYYCKVIPCLNVI